MLEADVPAAPPVNPPVTTGIGHVYVVDAGTMPLVPSTGVAVKFPPLQIAAGVMLVIADFGLTVTVTVKVAPAHVPDGVTV